MHAIVAVATLLLRRGRRQKSLSRRVNYFTVFDGKWIEISFLMTTTVVLLRQPKSQKDRLIISLVEMLQNWPVKFQAQRLQSRISKAQILGSLMIFITTGKDSVNCTSL